MASPPPPPAPPAAPVPVPTGRFGPGCMVGGCAAGCGTAFVLVTVACGLVYWFGARIWQEQVRTQLEESAVVRDHVGLPLHCEVDWTASFADPDQDVFVFRLSGPGGEARARLRLKTRDDGSEQVLGGTLELPDGRRLELDVAADTEDGDGDTPEVVPPDGAAAGGEPDTSRPAPADVPRGAPGADG